MLDVQPSEEGPVAPVRRTTTNDSEEYVKVCGAGGEKKGKGGGKLERGGNDSTRQTDKGCLEYLVRRKQSSPAL